MTIMTSSILLFVPTARNSIVTSKNITRNVLIGRTCRSEIVRNYRVKSKYNQMPIVTSSQLPLTFKEGSQHRITEHSLRFLSKSTSTKSNFFHNEPSESRNKDNHERVIITDIDKGIAHVQLARPDKMNGLDRKMFHAIAETISKIRNDKSIRVVILSGMGKAFCTGLDVTSFIRRDITNPVATLHTLLEDNSTNDSSSRNDNHILEFEDLLQRPSGYERQENVIKNSNNSDGAGNLAQDIAYLWRDLSVPVIAVLHGMCFGGGMQMALGADMRYTTPTCKLSLMEAKWGIIPDMSASITLRELIPIDIAKELTMTGRVISGIEAKEIGLVTKVCDDPMKEALDVANEIMERSPDSVTGCKRLLQECWVETDEKVCLEKETDIQKQLLQGHNMVVAIGKNFGIQKPYRQ